MFIFWLLLGMAAGTVGTWLFLKDKPTVMADAVVVRQELRRIEEGLAGSVTRLHTRFDEVLAAIKQKV